VAAFVGKFSPSRLHVFGKRSFYLLEHGDWSICALLVLTAAIESALSGTDVATLRRTIGIKCCFFQKKKGDFYAG